MPIHPGVPTIEAITDVESRPSYEVLRSYSKEFLSRNSSAMEGYKWIRDSFNQWSRIYEYPYCYEAITDNLLKGASVLDAGSGVTFFPFLLGSTYNITCVDQDDYQTTYARVNKQQSTNVNFLQSKLNNIRLPSDTFDAIYCISVLEHTEARNEILQEFHRLLKPGGLVVITFDIALNNNSLGIDRESSIALIRTAETYFDFDYSARNLDEDLGSRQIYSTKYVSHNLPQELLPWPRVTFLGSLKNLLLGRDSYSNVDLTFCTLAGTKKPVATDRAGG